MYMYGYVRKVYVMKNKIIEKQSGSNGCTMDSKDERDYYKRADRKTEKIMQHVCFILLFMMFLFFIFDSPSKYGHSYSLSDLSEQQCPY